MDGIGKSDATACNTEDNTNPKQHDKDQTNITVTGDDASSERKLTAPEPLPFDAIQVSKDFKITRT
jgi:hypothetical protein